MGYKIVVDSCCDLPDEIREKHIFENIPLTLHIDGEEITDDETFNQQEFIEKVDKSEFGGKSSCPSPQTYMDAYNCDAEDVYVVTLSAELSGSYNSAVVGMNMYKEELGEKNIHVFNSKSASCGETLIALNILKLAEEGHEFEEIVELVETYIDELDTYFVLETLEPLRKNGRLKNLTAFVATALNIKPIMGATDIGTICMLNQARGINKALKKMVETVAKRTKNAEEKILAIAHCNCPERAEVVKAELQKLCKFKEIIIVKTGGISTLYANNGGVIIAV